MFPLSLHWNKTLTNYSHRPPAEFIPPAEQPYQYIIFRASEVKDLSVDPVEAPPPRRSVHDDPAVLGVSLVYFHKSSFSISLMKKPRM